MTILHKNGKSNNHYSLFSVQRNPLLSLWNVLFEENPKEWISFKPALGLSVYPCYACRHMFSSLTSLQDHVNRRVIILKYNCTGCTNDLLTFYNRCSLLLHMRNHFGLNGGSINLKEIMTFPLPISLTGFLPHPNIPFIYQSEDDMVTENIYINAQFYSPDPMEKGMDHITMKPSDLIFRQNGELLALKQVCKIVPKCVFITVEDQKLLKKHLLAFQENNNNNINSSHSNDNLQIKTELSEDYNDQLIMPIISKVESLRDKLQTCLECGKSIENSISEHYRGNFKPTDPSQTCHDCKMIASTSCSLKAHKRIHNRDPPYVCPDCGGQFEEWSLLKKHFDEICFHLSKLIRYRCPGKRCGKLFATNVTFASHFRLHLKNLYACSNCNIIIVNEADTEEHKTFHNEPTNFAKLYDCSLCTNIEALTEKNFEEHIEYHINDPSRCMYVYICKSCKSYFRSTTTFSAHLLKCHGKKNQPDIKSNKGLGSKYITKDCENCQNKIIYNIEKPVSICNKCVHYKQINQNSKNLKAAKRYYCILCNKHILYNEKILHMKVCKYGRAIVPIPKINPEEVTHFSCSSSSSETSLNSSKSPNKRPRHEIEEHSKKRKKRIYIPNYKNRKQVQLDLTADEPTPFNGTYSCKLCDYTNTEREEFHVHIKNHRDISTAYQCMECGECFVVKPSLHKHLLHFHNISDYESYLMNNDCYDIEAVKELEEMMNLAPGESKIPVKENQCRVCLQEFQDSVTMNKHYRIHGMAFLLKNSK